ncbi:hypothetical protein ACFQT0_21995 [Hymenobacter humi]|uniref:Lipocalin-like domain-containing protein n=1 Tax=Hymenobacter humi TaxID=1411620 RepID=A0ABW2UBQ9_9BACT
MKRAFTTNLLSAVLLCVSLASCGDKEDAKPKEHDVEVRFQATAIPSNYTGQWYVEENDGSGATTTFATNPNSTESRIHKASRAKVKGNEIEAMVRLSPVTSTATLSVSTSIKADVVVDGVVKQTIMVDRNTPADQSGDRERSVLLKLE